MGIMDDVQGKMNDQLRDRYELLRGMAQEGKLDDEARAEFEQLRDRFERGDNS